MSAGWSFKKRDRCKTVNTWSTDCRHGDRYIWAQVEYISISVSAICTSRIYSLAAISFLKISTCAHIYLSPSLESVLHVFTVLQRSLFLKLQPALIYIYLRPCNLYLTYLQSCSDLFSSNFNLRSYISISVVRFCTSRIYSFAAICFLKTSTCAHIYLSLLLDSVLHIFTVLKRSLFLKLQPALIYVYLRRWNLYFTYLQSSAISFLKTSTCAHIYLSLLLDSVLHIFTVLKRSLFLKLQPALIYVYLRRWNLYFTYLQSSAISFLKTSTCAHIYLSLLLDSVLHIFTVLQRSFFLKTSTCAHIYVSLSLESVLHVFTVLQRSLFLKLQPALVYIYLRLFNLYFTYLKSCSDLFS